MQTDGKMSHAHGLGDLRWRVTVKWVQFQLRKMKKFWRLMVTE